MVKLDKSIIRGKIKKSAKKEINATAKPESINVKKSGAVSKEAKKPQAQQKKSNVAEIDDNGVEKLSASVMLSLKKDGVLPTPVNYEIYFDKLLEQKPIAFRKKINEILEPEKNNQNEHRSILEKEIKESFTYIKNIFSTVQSIYKNLRLMKEITAKKIEQINSSPDTNSTQAYIEDFEASLKKLVTILDKQVNNIKNHYDKTSEVLKRIEQSAIFDTTYGVYNRRYLMEQLKQEQKNIDLFGHKSSLLALKVKDELLETFPSQKEKVMLTRIISKLLLKSSRRSDIVTHYGSGIFILMLKHTSVDNAQKAAERILGMIGSTSFFLSSREIEIDVEIAISEIKTEISIEELIVCLLDELPKSGSDYEPYIVADCGFEEEVDLSKEDIVTE